VKRERPLAANCPARRGSNVVSAPAIPPEEEGQMSEFSYLYRGNDPQASPEQRQQQLQKWVGWFKELGAAGHLKNPGHPLERVGMVVTGSRKLITDGPYAEAKDVVGGFSIIEAKDLAQAVELSKGCPILEGGGSVEVRPIMQINL
jgi:hypothetical protein